MYVMRVCVLLLFAVVIVAAATTAAVQLWLYCLSHGIPFMSHPSLEMTMLCSVVIPRPLLNTSPMRSTRSTVNCSALGHADRV